MVVTPVLRGLFGMEARDRGRTLEDAPSLPADWSHAKVKGFAAGKRRLDVEIRRSAGATEIEVTPAKGDDPAQGLELDLAPAVPLDARVAEARVDGKPAAFQVERIGEVQRVRLAADLAARPVTIRIAYEGGTEVFVRHERPDPGGRSEGLRIVRARAGADSLDLVLEGVPQRDYQIGIVGRQVRAVEGVQVVPAQAVLPGSAGSQVAYIRFQGTPGTYVRREVSLPFTPATRAPKRRT
jgi:hypothetical protein